jgi:hypothetical protein
MLTILPRGDGLENPFPFQRIYSRLTLKGLFSDFFPTLCKHLGDTVDLRSLAIGTSSKQDFQKYVDMLLSFYLASPLRSRIHRRGKQLHFTHEKEIHFTISIL